MCNQPAVDYVANTTTYLWAGGICIVGCWAGCCLAPFLMNDFKQPVHTCTNCGRMAGKGHARFG